MLVTVVAAIGILVNIIAAWVLAKANRESLNVEGSFQHILTDLYAFIGTFIAGVVIIMTGFDRADAIASIAVAALMIRSGYVLQRKSIRVLLESAPEATTPSDVGWTMARTPQVSEVHDLHLWELTPGRRSSPRTCSSRRAPIATRFGVRSSSCCARNTVSRTRRCRSITRRTSCCRSRSGRRRGNRCP